MFPDISKSEKGVRQPNFFLRFENKLGSDALNVRSI